MMRFTHGLLLVEFKRWRTRWHTITGWKKLGCRVVDSKVSKSSSHTKFFANEATSILPRVQCHEGSFRRAESEAVILIQHWKFSGSTFELETEFVVAITENYRHMESSLMRTTDLNAYLSIPLCHEMFQINKSLVPCLHNQYCNDLCECANTRFASILTSIGICIVQNTERQSPMSLDHDQNASNDVTHRG